MLTIVFVNYQVCSKNKRTDAFVLLTKEVKFEDMLEKQPVFIKFIFNCLILGIISSMSIYHISHTMDDHFFGNYIFAVK